MDEQRAWTKLYPRRIFDDRLGSLDFGALIGSLSVHGRLLVVRGVDGRVIGLAIAQWFGVRRRFPFVTLLRSRHVRLVRWRP